ncbi:MAG: 4Fe-4S binding protein, partial [Vampirovibrionia bacterium]
MLNTLKIRWYQGYQAIKDIKKAEIKNSFRGLPIINSSLCTSCQKCTGVCPVNAIEKGIKIDLGKCLFCGDCARECPNNAITFTNYHKLSTTDRENLIVDKEINITNYEERAIKSKKEINKIFGRSLKLRQVSAGGCNGCELELNACSNVNFDMG